jgi:hypothetical protein
MIVMNIAATYTTLTATFWLTRLAISDQCGNDRFSSAVGAGVAGTRAADRLATLDRRLEPARLSEVPKAGRAGG